MSSSVAVLSSSETNVIAAVCRDRMRKGRSAILFCEHDPSKLNVPDFFKMVREALLGEESDLTPDITMEFRSPPINAHGAFIVVPHEEGVSFSTYK